MGCCGEKRKAWKKEKIRSSLNDNPQTINVANKRKYESRIFQYLGSNPISFIGIYTGKSYFFQFKGQKLKVDFLDSFPLMAEQDLIQVSNKQNSKT